MDDAGLPPQADSRARLPVRVAAGCDLLTKLASIAEDKRPAHSADERNLLATARPWISEPAVAVENSA